MQLAISRFRKGADGDLAASAEAVEQRTLASGGGAGRIVVQECQVFPRGRVPFTDFDAERTLSGSRAHDLGGNDLLDQFRLAQAPQTGKSKDDGVVFALLELAQACVDVATQGMNIKIGADGFELRLAAQAGGAHKRALRQVFDSRIKPRAEGVTRILPFRNRSDFESRRKFSWQVFQRMDSKIDLSGSEGLFDLFGKHPFGSDHRQSNVGDFVARGVNDLDLDFVPARAKKRRNVIRLPESKLRTAGTDAEFRHRQSEAGYRTKAKGG